MPCIYTCASLAVSSTPVYYSHNSQTLASFQNINSTMQCSICTTFIIFETKLNILNQLFLLIYFCERHLHLPMNQSLKPQAHHFFSYLSLGHIVDNTKFSWTILLNHSYIFPTLMAISLIQAHHHFLAIVYLSAN